MIAGIPSYHDYVREKGRPIGRCGACGFSGPMSNGETGYECPTCRSMTLDLDLAHGIVYQQFRPGSGIAAKETARLDEQRHDKGRGGRDVSEVSGLSGQLANLAAASRRVERGSLGSKN
jgi:hypothetical protein